MVYAFDREVIRDRRTRQWIVRVLIRGLATLVECEALGYLALTFVTRCFTGWQ